MSLRPSHGDESPIRRRPRVSGDPCRMDSRFRGNDRTFERAGDLANRGQELPLVRIGSKSFAHEDAIGRIPREEPQSPNTRDSALLALEGQRDVAAATQTHRAAGCLDWERNGRRNPGRCPDGVPWFPSAGAPLTSASVSRRTGMASSKKNQMRPPWPERDRSKAADKPF